MLSSPTGWLRSTHPYHREDTLRVAPEITSLLPPPAFHARPHFPPSPFELALISSRRRRCSPPPEPCPPPVSGEKPLPNGISTSPVWGTATTSLALPCVLSGIHQSGRPQTSAFDKRITNFAEDKFKSEGIDLSSEGTHDRCCSVGVQCLWSSKR